jgi:predicted DNA-binding transcriptional regulator YafY
MKRFEGRIERLDDIERQLSRYLGGLTTGQLARLYGVDPSTIHRDISALERRGTGLTKNGRRWVLDHRRALYSLKLSNYEVVALFLAARLLSRHSDEQNPHVAKALAKLADALRDRSPLVAAHIDEAGMAVADHPPRPEYVEAFEALTRGWVESRKVRLSYYGYQSQERTERTFCPYFFEPSAIGYALYVIGFDELRQGLRTLKIERIHEACVTDEYFARPAQFDPRHRLSSAWGVMWSEGENIEVQLRFSARVVRRVKETLWHASQRIDDLPDGSCLFTVQIGSVVELRPWIRQWGADVEILRPADLRAEIAEEAHRLAAMYAHTEDTPP